MAEKLFAKPEADALLPRLRAILAGLQRLASSDELVDNRQHLVDVGRSNGSAEAAAKLMDSAAELRGLLAEIEAAGVILRDPESGLCDFPAERDGEEIYLCWRLGEDQVSWWHPRDTGVAGRQPL
jgi:hypothetical protein